MILIQMCVCLTICHVCVNVQNEGICLPSQRVITVKKLLSERARVRRLCQLCDHLHSA